MEKVTDFIGREIFYDCLVCSLRDKELISPGGLIYEDKNIIIFPHPQVKLKGFIVVAPKRHVSQLSDLTDEENFAITEATKAIEHTLSINQVADDFNVQLNISESGHLENWIIPKLYPILEKDVLLKYFASDEIMRYRSMEPSEPIEILYTVQILKTYFKAKAFLFKS